MYRARVIVSEPWSVVDAPFVGAMMDIAASAVVRVLLRGLVTASAWL